MSTGDSFSISDKTLTYGWLFRSLINTKGSYPLFSQSSYQSDISVLGLGPGSRPLASPSETFLWQLEGTSVVSVGDQEFRLRQDDTLRLPGGEGEFLYIPSSESLTLSVVMNPDNKPRPDNN